MRYLLQNGAHVDGSLAQQQLECHVANFTTVSPALESPTASERFSLYSVTLLIRYAPERYDADGADRCAQIPLMWVCSSGHWVMGRPSGAPLLGCTTAWSGSSSTGASPPTVRRSRAILTSSWCAKLL